MHSDNSESLTPSLEQRKKIDHFGLGGWLGHHHRGVLMAVGHGVWKCSEPLFDQIKWLGIAIHDPLGSSEQRIGVSGTQQRLLRALPHGLPTETSRWGTTHCGVLMAVGHGVWKCPGPLFGQVQWLSIAKHVPLGSSEQGIDVSGSQQRLLHALPHGLPTETSRQGTRGPVESPQSDLL